jgi:hypothetical protein
MFFARRRGDPAAGRPKHGPEPLSLLVNSGICQELRRYRRPISRLRTNRAGFSNETPPDGTGRFGSASLQVAAQARQAEGDEAGG